MGSDVGEDPPGVVPSTHLLPMGLHPMGRTWYRATPRAGAGLGGQGSMLVPGKVLPAESPGIILPCCCKAEVGLALRGLACQLLRPIQTHCIGDSRPAQPCPL